MCCFTYFRYLLRTNYNKALNSSKDCGIKCGVVLQCSFNERIICMVRWVILVPNNIASLDC